MQRKGREPGRDHTLCPKSQEMGRKIVGAYAVDFWHLEGIQNLGWYLKSRSTGPFLSADQTMLPGGLSGQCAFAGST